MEKLGAAFGGGPSRKELQETVAGQKRQLLRYQARLQDVVRAYKSLLAEKEALEAGLKALSARHQPQEPPGDPNQGDSSPEPHQGRRSSGAPSEEKEEEDGGGLGALGWPGQEEAQETSPRAEEEEEEAAEGSRKSGLSSGAGEEEEEEAAAADRRGLVVRRLRSQVATLTAALATVAQEKSRMEASYQADKRQARQEAEEAARAAEEERSRRGAELRAAQAQLAETKARLIAQQHDRAQEQSDHALMLRELQRLLQSERAQREEAERGLEEAREALAGKASVAERAEGSECQARQLRQEVEGLRKELRAVRAESSKPDPRLQELRAEAESLRSHLQAQLLQEMRKSAHAEERVQMEEQRVASLEAQVSEMSELLGRYERAKQKDQVALQKLRDRIAQLDLENKTLAMAASGRPPTLDLAVEESHMDVNVLKDKMEKLRTLLRGAHKPSQEEEEEEADLDQTEVLEAADGEKATAVYYRQELKQLKEEFERYKLRAQVVLKSKSAKDGSLAKELEQAREQLAELREKYVSLRLSCEELATQHQEEREATKQEATHLQQLHRQDLERCQLDYQEKVFKLEEEMHKQRDRALAILAEKDQELEQLRVALALPYGLTGPKPHSGCSPSLDGSRGQEAAGDGGPLESLTQALRLTAPGEPTFLLYTEQLARKEVEVSSLKKQKHRLEAQLHHLQERLLAEGEQHQEEVSVLQSCLQKVGRDQKRAEGANLEYLKNIFYRFLTLADALGRQQTLTAILTILHFSPEEKQEVLGHAGGGSHSWWPSGKR